MSQPTSMRIILEKLNYKNLPKPKKAPPRFTNTDKKRLILATIFGGVLCGINYYFQNYQAQQLNNKQRQLIQRVQNDQIGNQFLQNFDFHQLNQWQCKKIVLDGSITDGRFFVKRNRGNEEGYIVLAPFTVQRKRAMPLKRSIQRKFMLNLGWIPKDSKYLVKNLITPDCIGQNQYTRDNRIQAIEKQRKDGLLRDPNYLQNTVPITTVEAYIRKGETRDPLNGYNNWREQKLYKFIDLKWLCNLFRISNSSEAETIYLQRAAKNEEEMEVTPIPTTKEHVIAELKQRMEMNNKTRDRNIFLVTELISLGVLGVLGSILL